MVIPTYGRGDRICVTIEKLQACDPGPSEIWVHVDQATGELEGELSRKFPSVRVIASKDGIGPGGGRHRCLQACTAPLAASFDDDSYPIDTDFFARVARLFERYQDAALIGATIWHRQQPAMAASSNCERSVSFTGCGHIVRVAAYRSIMGYVPRPIAYGLEETDVSLQFFATGQVIYKSADLRVFHDTDLKHHQSKDITECVVANAALMAFLRYPVWLWSWGVLQLLSTVVYCLRVGRWRGVGSGLVRIPSDCIALRRYRLALPSRTIIDFLRARRAR